MELDEKAIKYHTLGNTLLTERKYNDAIFHYKKAVEIEPEYASAWYHLAETYEAKNLDEDAEKAFFKAIELKPSFADIHIQSGLDSLIYGPLGKAIAEYKKIKGISSVPITHAEAPAEKKPAAPQPKGVRPSAAQSAKPSAATAPTVPASAPRTAAAAPSVGRRRLEALPSAVMNSPAGAEGAIQAKLTNENGAPAAGVTVDFRLRLDQATGDAVIFPPGAGEKGRKTVSAVTDARGIAEVKFRRASRVGENRVYISATDVEAVRLCDRTVPAGLERVEVGSSRGGFTAGVETAVIFRPRDRFDNIMPDTEFDVVPALKDGDWKREGAFKVKTDKKGDARRALKLPERAGGAYRFEISDVEKKSTVAVEVAIAPGAPEKIRFHPDSGSVAAGEKFTLAVRIEDRFGNPVPGNFTSLVLKERGEEEWALGEPPDSVTDAEGTIFFPVTPPARQGAKAKIGVSATGFGAADEAVAEFVTGAAGEAGARAGAMPWAGGEAKAAPAPAVVEAAPVIEVEPTPAEAPPPVEMPKVEEKKPVSMPDNFLAPLDLKMDEEMGGAIGLPEIPLPARKAAPATEIAADEAPAPPMNEIEPAVETEQPAASEATAATGGGAGAFDGIDFDGGSMFGPALDAPKAAVKVGEKDFFAPAGAVKSAFAELDDMLSLGGGGQADIAPSVAPPTLTEEVVDEPFEIVLPEKEPAPVEAEEILPEGDLTAPPAPPLDLDLPLPETEAIPEVAPSLPELKIVLEEHEKTLPAGELLPVVVKILDPEGNRLDGKNVVLTIREDETGGMDSAFIRPDGEEGGRAFEAVSDMTGTVMVNLRVSRVAGRATALVSCEDQLESLQLEVTQTPPALVELSPAAIEAGPGETVEVRARVLDGNGNPVKGAVCTFALDESSDRDGELAIQLQSMTDENGEVTVEYTASANPGAAAVITADCAGVGAEGIEPARITTRRGIAAAVSAREAAPAVKPAVEAPPAPVVILPIDEEEPSLREPDWPPLPEEHETVKFAAPPQRLPPLPPAPHVELPIETDMEDLTMEEPRFPPPAPPEEDFAPPPPPASKRTGPPVPPPPPKIEFLEDELPHQTAGLEYGRRSGGVTAEEIAAELEEAMPQLMPPVEQDPYAAPKFHVDKGKKAIIEVDKVASKTVNLAVIAAAALVVIFLGYFGYKKISTSYHFMQGLKAFNAGEYDKAIPHFDKCARMSEGWTKPLSYLAQVHFEKAENFKKQDDTEAFLKEIQLSIGMLDEVVRINPSDAEALYARGQAYEFKGENAKALADYKKVIALDPSYSGAKMKIESLGGELGGRR